MQDSRDIPYKYFVNKLVLANELFILLTNNILHNQFYLLKQHLLVEHTYIHTRNKYKVLIKNYEY